MRLSARVEYACLAVLELAARFNSNERVRVREIAERHGIPPAFLVQILLQLKTAGLVESSRGASGGYRLARSPQRISLWDIVSSIERQAVDTPDEDEQLDPALDVVRRTWFEVQQQLREALGRIHVDHMLERFQSHAELMYHI